MQRSPQRAAQPSKKPPPGNTVRNTRELFMIETNENCAANSASRCPASSQLYLIQRCDRVNVIPVLRIEISLSPSCPAGCTTRASCIPTFRFKEGSSCGTASLSASWAIHLRLLPRLRKRVERCVRVLRRTASCTT